MKGDHMVKKGGDVKVETNHVFQENVEQDKKSMRGRRGGGTWFRRKWGTTDKGRTKKRKMKPGSQRMCPHARVIFSGCSTETSVVGKTWRVK